MESKENVSEALSDLRTAEVDHDDLRSIHVCDGFRVVLIATMNHETLAEIYVSDYEAAEVVDCLLKIVSNRKCRLLDTIGGN